MLRLGVEGDFRLTMNDRPSCILSIFSKGGGADPLAPSPVTTPLHHVVIDHAVRDM